MTVMLYQLHFRVYPVRNQRLLLSSILRCLLLVKLAVSCTKAKRRKTTPPETSVSIRYYQQRSKHEQFLMPPLIIPMRSADVKMANYTDAHVKQICTTKSDNYLDEVENDT